MSAPTSTDAPAPRTARLVALRADLADLAGSDTRLFAFAKRAAWFLVPLTLTIVVVVFGTGPEPRRNWYGDMLGNDFSQVWVAGRAALDGRGGEPYDLPVHLENLKAAFGPECRFAWHYPPVFLLPAAAMALLEPQPAFLLWTGLSLGLFALAMAVAAGRRDAACIALAHPLVFCNLSYGQNGLFTAALLTLGAVLVDRRPWLAGLCFGLLAYKPQFAVLAPLLLLITGRRLCLAACLATVLAQCVAALALFGTTPWIGFLGTLGDTNRIILQKAAAGLDLNASAFGAIRLLGGPPDIAWALQGVTAALALGLACRAWLTPASLDLRAAILLAAAPLLSPYVPVYDLAPLVPATLLLTLAAHRAGGLRRSERALLFAAPLFALVREVAGLTGLSLGLALSLATLACISRRIQPWGLPAGASRGTGDAACGRAA
jgi:hypothetical protein